MIAIIIAMAFAQTDTLPSDPEILNRASIEAMENARVLLEEQIVRKEELGRVKRIGVATIADDQGKVIEHLKNMLVKTPFDIVLINDVEWGHLLDEFARQQMRDDLILTETAHELRVQGVDAVLWGSLDAFEVADFQHGADMGRQATVRVQLTLASAMEHNPGSLLWSDEAYAVVRASPTPSSQELLRHLVDRYGLLIAGAVGAFALFIVWLGYKRLVTPR